MKTAESSSLLILISAPSGGGKTTLCNSLLAARPGMTRAVTCTTREPRPGEKDGVDYYFFSAAEFAKRVAAGEFIEHATVFGRSYGILRSELAGQAAFRPGRFAERGRAGSGNDPRQGPGGAGVETRPGFDFSDAAVGVRAGRAVDKAQLGFGGGNPEAAGRGAAMKSRSWSHFDYLLISESVAEDLRRMLAIVEAENDARRRVRRAPANFELIAD